VWVAVLSISGYVSLASVLAAVVVPIVVLLVQGVGPVFGLALAIGLFVIFAHRANIKRLLRGEEHRFRRKTEPSA
jgi:glycerol-3-phosphate acyltransferase PlsY